ncbi:DUF3857 domain-containing protein [Chryseosolibacter indicus]|uniref:Transglutaminase-like domain-containing protein n=1 Tax=Chryseosolibacter indicus TaxID=2782351 RepID=A0ABS5VVJ6_9BACT|nr:DUF3857 domain-containing protein [Chryseosolibacter indicus]MBT1705463.1 transglutaminase-like domain-containing protein [Chryseosolibacter indicus]
MKAIFTAIVLLSISLNVFPQKSPLKFGDIPMDDLNMKVYSKDTSASAVVLSDYGEAYIRINTTTSSLLFERHTRIKILKKEGLDWANVEVPLYHFGSSEEKVTNLKASTFNLENGKIVEAKMSKDGIFKDKFNRNIFLHKFTLPNVKEGSVIEYSYTINSDLLWNFPNWQFQRTIPTRHSEYWAILPEFFVFEKYMQGYVSPTTYEVKNKPMSDYQSNAHHWIIKDVHAFKEEPFMTSEEDFISRINFALSHINFPGEPVREIMGSWAKLNQILLDDEDFGGVIRGSGFLKKTVEEVTAGIDDPVKKITALHNYVKRNLEWDGHNDFFADNLKTVIEKKKGSSGDLNLLLASMVSKAGFEVEPVILSTRDHGFVRMQYPMSKQFNYVVCLVRLPENKTIFLDATDKFIPISVLPERCLNGQGLIISKTRHGWINLETKAKAKTVASAEFNLAGNGEMKGKLTFNRDGYDANKARRDYTSKGHNGYVKNFLGTKLWQIEKSDFQNVDEVENSLREVHELVLNDHASVSGDIIYVNPFITTQLESNPFKLDERMYPVNYSSVIEKVYMCKLILPESFTIDEIPQSKVITLPNNAARYLYNVTQMGNMVHITSNFQINKSLFTQDEYPFLREFYDQVVAKQNEQIVLRKKP